MIERYTFIGEKKGPHVLFFGSVHGDERCGSIAIDHFVEKMQQGKMRIEKGRVTFIPRVNRLAYEKNIRFVDINLNRVFCKGTGISREEMLAQRLLPFFEGVDYFVDLHSMTAKTEPMVFLDYPNVASKKISEMCNVDYIVTGWPKTYKKEERSSDTCAYAQRVGVAGVTVECGQHRDMKSVRTAISVVENVLIGLGLSSPSGGAKKQKVKFRRIEMKQIVFREWREDFFIKDWKNFETVKKGREIGRRKNGESITAPYDAYILLPNKEVVVGGEWFYLGVEKT